MSSIEDKMKAIKESIKPKQLTKNIIKRSKKITEDTKKIKQILKEDDPILNKLKRMSERIRKTQREEDEKVIRQSAKKSKRHYKESSDITIDRNDRLLRRGYILLKEPQDEDAFNERLGIALQRPDNTDVRQDDNDEPFTVYGLTNIRMWQDVNTKLDEIYSKTVKPFKIRFTFNGIYESEMTNGEEAVYDYREDSVWDKESVNLSTPTVIRNQQSLKDFKLKLKNFVSEIRQNITQISSKWQLICIHRLEFRVYRLRNIGKGLVGLEEFIKSRFIYVPTSDDYFCWDYCYQLHLMSQRKDPIRYNVIYKAGRRNAYKRIYNKEPNTNSHEYRDFIKNYKGLNLSTDIENYCKFYRVNVQLFGYNNCKYYLEHEYHYDDNYSMMFVLVHNFHAMLIKDDKAVQRLTEVIFCSKCHQPICRYNRKNLQKQIRTHANSCSGRAGSKRMIKPTEQVYLPHIFKNPVYAYCLAHNIEYQPIRYYITYDFETVEESCERSISNATVINSILHPLSVASTIKSKKGIRTIYYDLRDGDDFITKWISQLFIEADKMKEDNLIKGVPLEKQLKDNKYVITILGYNSSRFDINILLKHLESDNWHIVSLLGCSTKFKQVLVQQNNLILRFIDAMCLAGTGTLKDFVDSFGNGLDNKGLFPYEAININNYNDVLSKPEPFEQKDFYSYLNQKALSDNDYEMYLDDAKRFKTRWDYLQHYNELDTQIMINPIDTLIELNWERKVDCLKNLSLSSNASQIKYAEIIITILILTGIIQMKQMNQHSNYQRTSL